MGQGQNAGLSLSQEAGTLEIQWMGSELESRDAWWDCDLKVWIETRNPKCLGVSIHANPISEAAGLSHQLVPWSITDSMTAATEKNPSRQWQLFKYHIMTIGGVPP